MSSNRTISPAPRPAGRWLFGVPMLVALLGTAVLIAA